MAILGRNDICYCGTGKKYKKCCLIRDERNKEMGIRELPKAKSFQFGKLNHNFASGLREAALALLNLLQEFLDKDHVIPSNIEVYASELCRLVQDEDAEEAYISRVRNITVWQNAKFTPDVERLCREHYRNGARLTLNERSLINTVSQSHLSEFVMLGAAQTADYSVMRIINQMAYEAVKQGIHDEKTLVAVNVTVDTDELHEEQLVNWELDFLSDWIDLKRDKPNNLMINWKSLDTLTNEYHKYAHSMNGLEEASKNDLATAMHQELSIPTKHKYSASYSGLVSIYTSILERELRSTIELKEGKTKTKLMFKAINDYILNNEEMFKFFDETPSSLYERLEKVRDIRNRVSHGNRISYDDFEYVKDFAINRQMLERISWEKIALEDKETDSEELVQ